MFTATLTGTKDITIPTFSISYDDFGKIRPSWGNATGTITVDRTPGFGSFSPAVTPA